MEPILDLIDQVTGIDQGRVSPQQAIDAAFEKAQARESQLRAFAFLPDETPACGSGALAGIAVGVKDLIDTADMPTAYGSAAFSGHRPAQDAWIVARLRALGATVLGKTVTTEFAFRSPGPTRHPLNPHHTPGGSSSGSAAAVAAGILPLALGTQTLGSVIRPAAFCGIVGYKPSFGVLPRQGVHPLSGALDHLGLMARSIDDVAFVMSLLLESEAFSGARLCIDASTHRMAGLAAPRLGLLPLPGSDVEPAQVAAFEAAVAALKAQRHSLETVVLPDAFATIPSLAQTLLAYEAAQIFQDIVADNPDTTSDALKTLVASGIEISETHYWSALDQQQALRQSFAALMTGLDGLVTIPATGEAPEGLDWTGDPRFCLVWSFLGAPAVTWPVGRGPCGLPLGLQVVAPLGQDAGLLRTAKTLAEITGF